MRMLKLCAVISLLVLCAWPVAAKDTVTGAQVYAKNTAPFVYCNYTPTKASSYVQIRGTAAGDILSVGSTAWSVVKAADGTVVASESGAACTYNADGTVAESVDVVATDRPGVAEGTVSYTVRAGTTVLASGSIICSSVTIKP